MPDKMKDSMQIPKMIISASRRTDIPAFYMEWFMDQIRSGYFIVKNPVTGISKKILVSKHATHTIVFWSKDFGHFFEMKAGQALSKAGFHLYFNFTINSQSVLEPNVPALTHRLDQLKSLCETFGPDKVAWRFDPICYYQMGTQQKLYNNLSDFKAIAEFAASLGIKNCVTSFVDPYKKIDKRLIFLKAQHGLDLKIIRVIMNKKLEILNRMENVLRTYGIRLSLCCEREIIPRLDAGSEISENACINGRLLKTLFKGFPETKKDYGQRSQKGCKCTKSIDIGSYDDHPCLHNCIFCYANTEIDQSVGKGAMCQ